MPYTEAFTIESQRYTSPITTGLGRAVMEDTVFEGYQIKKGDYVRNIYTKICPCNIHRFFQEAKNENFIGKKIDNFDTFLLKTFIVGTR